MSVKNFKFVSPGVFIKEIDNSAIPRSADAIGPVVIGRAQKGLALQPVAIESYSDFVKAFGDTVPGWGGGSADPGDVYRYGNYQSPMYGTYAAKAFLASNVAPLTYVRVLGQEHTNATSAGKAGWKTAKMTMSDGLGSSYTGTKATAEITVTAWASTVNGQTIVLTNDELDSVTFTLDTSIGTSTATKIARNGSVDSNTKLATKIKEAINLATGLGLTAVTDGANKVTITQKGYGNDGNTAITNGIAGLTVPDAFTGGTDSPDIGGGGAYGLFIGASGSGTPWTGSLAAILYSNSGSIRLSGTLARDPDTHTASAGALVNCQSDGTYKLVVSSSQAGVNRVVKFGLNDQDENFIRKKLNTNPQLMYDGAFYPTSSETDYWLGESYETVIRSASLATSTTTQGVICALALSGSDHTPSTTVTPAYQQASSREAVAGWFIGQDMGPAEDFDAMACQKLFRLKGRGHGSWLHKNTKVSISNIRRSNNPGVTDYGTFSVIIRHLNDTDSNVQVLERFDLCTLDPTSPNFVARKIGDRYQTWDTTEKRLKEYGDYPNNSEYVYVEMNAEVEAGATDPALLPFGYFGPPKLMNVDHIRANLNYDAGGLGQGNLNNKLVLTGQDLVGFADIEDLPKDKVAAILTSSHAVMASFIGAANGAGGLDDSTGCGITLEMGLHTHHVPLRLSASDGGPLDLGDSYFGMRTTRTADSSVPAQDVADYHNLLYAGFPDDPTVGSPKGVSGSAYCFSLNDVDKGKGSTNNAYYASGSRRNFGGTAAPGARVYSVADLLDQGYDKFTAPFWGGSDGFDIMKPDPMYNGGMTDSSTQESSYIYNTWRRAIDTVSDPEAVNMNLLVAPGLTLEGLTTKMINMCENRADALAIVDLPSVYIPPHEYYVSSKKNRIPNTPISNANSFRDRRIDSSYGCTFYPWVQTRDENTGILVWAPPSVAMLGVLGSSQAKSDVWFAPAGFNRGGLSDGAAGIPVTAVSQRLTSEDRDNLYVQNINPIASFPSTGLVAFGQKTTQQKQSALDRINVRRLVIYLKKQISVISSQILFEQNVEATWNRFKGLVEPFLANVKVQFGITDYKLILDESTTTPDLIDQNIMYAKIMVKPARAIEFIAIDFVIASTGASFDD